MASLLERLRDRDYRMTAQRRVVAQVLEGENLHLTADDVHRRAGDLLPEISRATVYNTLRELAEMGEILDVSTDGRSTRYDPNVDPPHHHLTCDSCGAIFDVQRGIPAPSLPPTETMGFEIDRAEIIYRGRCEACRRS